MNEVKTRRGRPRAYDPDEAMDRITDVFWQRGFAATSLDDLGAAAGMNRPSLYAAFGDKKAMFRAALMHFRDRMRARQRRSLETEPDIRAAVRGFLMSALETYGDGGEGARGCLVFSAASVEAVGDADIRDDLSDSLREMDMALARRFRRARGDGQLHDGADPAALAQLTAAIQHSLAIRARAGQPRKKLERFIDGALGVILPV